MSFDDNDKGALAEAMESAAFEIHRLEKENAALQSERTQLRLLRDTGSGGWTVDYGLLEQIAHQTRVSMEDVEAVVLEMVERGYTKLEPSSESESEGTVEVKCPRDDCDGEVGPMAWSGRDDWDCSKCGVEFDPKVNPTIASWVPTPGEVWISPDTITNVVFASPTAYKDWCGDNGFKIREPRCIKVHGAPKPKEADDAK